MHIRTVRHVRPTSSPPHWKVTKQTVLKKRRERKKRSKERKKVKRNPPRLVYLPNKTFPRKTHTSDTSTIYRSAVLHIYNLWLYIYPPAKKKFALPGDPMTFNSRRRVGGRGNTQFRTCASSVRAFSLLPLSSSPVAPPKKKVTRCTRRASTPRRQ